MRIVMTTEQRVYNKSKRVKENKGSEESMSGFSFREFQGKALGSLRGITQVIQDCYMVVKNNGIGVYYNSK